MCCGGRFLTLLLRLGAPTLLAAVRLDSEEPGQSQKKQGLATTSQLEVGDDHAQSSRNVLHAVNASSADEAADLAAAFAPTCCCRPEEIKKCKYVVQFIQENTPWCCKLRQGGCPTMSTYVKIDNEKRCYTEDYRQAMLGHPVYGLVTSASLEPAKAAWDWEKIKAVAVGPNSQTYLGRQFDDPENIVALKFPLKRPETKSERKGIKDWCENAKTVQRRIVKSSQGAAGAAHTITCLDYDKHMPFSVLPRHAGVSSQLVMPKLATARMVKQVFFALNALRLSEPSQAFRKLSWASFGVGSDGCLKITSSSNVFVEAAKKDKHSKETYPVLVGAPDVGPEDVKSLHTPPECREKNDQVPCHLGSSFDVYSAGVLAAVSLCGAPEYYILQGLRDDEEKLHKEVKEYIKMGMPGKEALYMAGYIRARSQWHSAKMHKQVDFLKSEIDRMNKRKLGLESETRIEQRFRSKWAFCKAMAIYDVSERTPSGRLTVIDRLRSSNPKRRPSPQAVLESGMFKFLKTGCPQDDAESSKKKKKKGGKS